MSNYVLDTSGNIHVASMEGVSIEEAIATFVLWLCWHNWNAYLQMLWWNNCKRELIGALMDVKGFCYSYRRKAHLLKNLVLVLSRVLYKLKWVHFLKLAESFLFLSLACYFNTIRQSFCYGISFIDLKCFDMTVKTYVISSFHFCFRFANFFFKLIQD